MQPDNLQINPESEEDKSEFTDEELAEAHQRGMAQIKAGRCVRVSMTDLERMVNE